MKKILLITLLLLNVNVKAYENDFFKLEIPTDFKESNEDGIYKWTNDNTNENIVITIVKNTNENKYNIERYTKEDIENYEKYLKESMDKQLESYNISVNVKNTKKEKLNDYDTISYDVYWPTKELTGNDIYQKGYTITTENYILSLTYTSTKEINNETEFYINSIKTLTISDKKIENNSFFSKKINRIILVGTIAGIIGYIISAIKKRK